MTKLSHQAQAVLNAAGATYADTAAILRAAADQVVPLRICGTNATRAQTRLGIRTKLLAIATELENQ